MEEINAEVPNTIGQNTIGQIVGAEKPRISRSDFIKLVAGAALAAPFAIKRLEKDFYEAIIIGITNPYVNNTVVSAALQTSESAPNSENPNFRPMVDILKEGISAYSGNDSQPAFFQRNKDYRNIEFYSDVIRKSTSKQVMPKIPSEVASEITTSFPPEAREAFEKSSVIATGFELLFVPGSGFGARFRKKHPEFEYENGKYLKHSSERNTLMDKDGGSEMKEMIQWVEETRTEQGKPISASFILARFLEKNAGNIPHSIFDTAIFLKFMARTDPNSGNFSADEKNIQWYRQNIKDEYQGPTFISPPEGEPAINLIGKPYHSWNLVSLLQFLPVEVVRVGGIQKQLSTFKEQGLGKTRADLQTLDDLREIEQLLLSFSSEEKR